MDIIVTIINQLGYVGIGCLIAIENIFPPIPSEIILTFSGYSTVYTNLSILGVAIAATIGSVVGAVLLYLVGNFFSHERVEKLMSGKIGKLLGFKVRDMNRAEKLFQKHGKATVFFCRLIPIVRSIISIPAGMMYMRFLPFVGFTFLGSFIWNLVLVYLGATSGNTWPTIVGYMQRYSKLVGVGILLYIAFRIGKHYIIKKFESQCH